MMELVIALDIGIEEIWLCRNPTGHNHADMDSKFGCIWVKSRKMVLKCPTNYKEMLYSTFKKAVEIVNVEEVFIVPEYDVALESSIDPKLSNCFKMEYTQHIWKFTKISKSAHFPLGVKCMYRAYAADEIPELIQVQSDEAKVGILARKVSVKWFPQGDATIGRPEGMRILTKLPDLNFKPMVIIQSLLYRRSYLMFVCLLRSHSYKALVKKL